MAKISELPSTASLTGTELVPIVQSSTTKSTLLSSIRSWLLSLNSAFTGNVTVGGTLGVTGDTSLSSINSGYLYGNRVINGAMEIDQANSGASITSTNIGYVYLTDMFGAFQSQSSKLTYQQVADAPPGLKNSMKITVASQYSPAATDGFNFFTAIEGKDIIDFQFGTSGALTITCSNWIKSSVPGTYAVSVRNGTGTRSYVGLINVTSSWSQVKITLPGDTTGTWTTDNTIGLSIIFDLGSGTNFNTTAGSWQAGNLGRTSGTITFVNQVAGSTINITGVDCRPGSVAPTYFERRLNELQLCQRYYEVGSLNPIYGYMRGSSEATPYVNMMYRVTKRAVPIVSVTWSGGTGPGLVSAVDGFDAWATGSFIAITAWSSSARLF